MTTETFDIYKYENFNLIYLNSALAPFLILPL